MSSLIIVDDPVSFKYDPAEQRIADLTRLLVQSEAHAARTLEAAEQDGGIRRWCLELQADNVLVAGERDRAYAVLREMRDSRGVSTMWLDRILREHGITLPPPEGT